MLEDRLMDNNTSKIIRPKQLAALLQISLTSLWRLRKQKIIPEPILIGSRMIGWQRSTIDEWLNSLNAQKSGVTKK